MICSEKALGLSNALSNMMNNNVLLAKYAKKRERKTGVKLSRGGSGGTPLPYGFGFRNNAARHVAVMHFQNSAKSSGNGTNHSTGSGSPYDTTSRIACNACRGSSSFSNNAGVTPVSINVR